jgi:hypothetical protein
MAFGFDDKQAQFTLFKFFSKIGMAFGFNDKLRQSNILSMFFSKREMAFGFDHKTSDRPKVINTERKD